MAEKVSRDRGYRSDTIAISRDTGPLIGVSQKGSRERCLPVFFVFLKMKRKKTENETEENGKNGKNRNPKKKQTKRRKMETEKKTEENETKRKKTEKIGSDTFPATPFAKSRTKQTLTKPGFKEI